MVYTVQGYFVDNQSIRQRNGVKGNLTEGSIVSILRDQQIKNLLDSKKIIKPQPNTDDITSISSSVQASSLDLHIGEIFSPRNFTSKTGAKAKTRYSLKSGETIVVKTLEKYLGYLAKVT